MSYNRRATIALYNFRGSTSRITLKDVTGKLISRIYSTLYSPPASSKSKLPRFSSSSSWHKPIPQLGIIAKTVQQSPFSGCTNRNYHGEVPNRSELFRTRWHDWCACVRANRRRLWAAVFIAFCWSRFETIPYSKRNHFMIVRREWEKPLADFWFKLMEIFSIGHIVADEDLRTIRVRSIGNDIIQGMMRGISREDQEKGIRRWWRGSRVVTSDLDCLKWEFHVMEDLEFNASSLPGGKIVVFTGLLRHFNSDEEIAAVICHEVAHVVARHGAEALTKNTWILILRLIFKFFQSFCNAFASHAHTFDGLFDVLFTFPLLRRMELEADYIGLMLLASAGYDPRVALDVRHKMSKLSGESPNQNDYFHTHPADYKRAQKLAEAHVMEEALSIYRDVQAARAAKQ